MKKQWLAYVIWLAAGLTAGCNRTVYTIHKASYRLPGQTAEIRLDASFNLYVRAVQAAPTIVPGNKKQRELSLFKGGVSKGGMPAGSPKIIEIEYLFLSPTIVVYISTVADRYETRYSSKKFMGIETPNAADFRVILIGRVDNADPDKYIFYDKKGKQTDTWTIQRKGDLLKLQLIEQKHFGQFEQAFILKDALYNDLAFTRQPGWDLRYLDTTTNVQEKMTEPAIYYTTGGKRFSLLLPFTGHCLTFPDDHIIYSPERKAYVKPKSPLL